MFTASKKTLFAFSLSTLTVLAVHAPVSQAFNFGNMMNPDRWIGNDNRDDKTYYGPYESGYGPNPYGVPYGTPYGVPGFAPPAGYAPPGYVGGAPVPAAPPAPPSPHSAATGTASELEALKRRIEELETKQQTAQPPAPFLQTPPPQSPPQLGDWPSAPAFRPTNQY